mmetsp:Transcript_30128/g.89364  ORF Transcript_30128/g.89364 Transcript_30128/m.89364 type:complete len:284 (-) Transcript_30128:1529-2380(-)
MATSSQETPWRAGQAVRVLAGAIAKHRPKGWLKSTYGSLSKTATLPATVARRGRGRAWVLLMQDGEELTAGAAQVYPAEATPRLGPKNEEEGMDLESSSDSEPEEAAGAPDDAPTWVEGDIPMCARESTGRHATGNGRLRRRELGQVDKAGAVIMFFESFFPTAILQDVLNMTSMKLRLHHRWRSPLTKAVFFAWLGLWVAMSRCEMANLDSYWAKPTGNAWEPAFNFGSVMSLSKFKSIKSCLTFPCPPQSTAIDDPFLDVRLWMDASMHVWNPLRRQGHDS